METIKTLNYYIHTNPDGLLFLTILAKDNAVLNWNFMYILYPHSKAYLISPANSLTFSKAEERSVVKQNNMSFVMGLFYCIFAIVAHNKQLFQDFLPENRVDGIYT